MNIVSQIKYLLKKSKLYHSRYQVLEPTTGNVVFESENKEDAYRVALGKVRFELLELDGSNRWTSLSAFDREVVVSGFEASYIKLRKDYDLEFPEVHEIEPNLK